MKKTAEKIESYLKEACAHLGIEEVEIIINEDENFFQIQINTSDAESGMLIGYHGENIVSLQRLISISFYDELDQKKIILNINNYKQKREENVINLARNMANQVLESGESVTLPYLPANERLIVHTALKEVSGVRTHSEGEGDQRRLVISLQD